MGDWAVTHVARERAELLSCPRPTEPLGVTQVQGRTLVSVISPGTELNWGYRGESFPSVTGYAAVVEVEDVGGQVTSVAPGDVVFCQGQHRSWQRCEEIETRLVPAGLDPEVAVFCRLMGITMSTLTTTAARPPERVLVTGLGIVGTLGALIFHACGYEVVAVDPDPARRQLAMSLGLPHVLSEVPVGDPMWAGRVGLVLESSGNEAAVLSGCQLVRPRGEVVLVGVPWHRQTDLTSHELLHAIFHRYAVVRSGWEWELPRQPEPFRMNSIYGNFAAAMQWLAQGRVTVSGLYQTVSPEECQRAYDDLLYHRGPALTFVFDWRRLT